MCLGDDSTTPLRISYLCWPQHALRSILWRKYLSSTTRSRITDLIDCYVIAFAKHYTWYFHIRSEVWWRVNAVLSPTNIRIALSMESWDILYVVLGRRLMVSYNPAWKQSMYIRVIKIISIMVIDKESTIVNASVSIQGWNLAVDVIACLSVCLCCSINVVSIVFYVSVVLGTKFAETEI